MEIYTSESLDAERSNEPMVKRGKIFCGSSSERKFPLLKRMFVELVNSSSMLLPYLLSFCDKNFDSLALFRTRMSMKYYLSSETLKVIR